MNSHARATRRVVLRSACAAGVTFAIACASPITITTRKIRLGALTAETLPIDGSRPELEQDVMEGLRDEGYFVDQNMTIEWRHAEGKLERLPVFVDELIKKRVDILIAGTTQAALAAKAATTTLPIIMLGCGDPIDYGVIDSYSRPGANITGTAFSNLNEATKRIELLHEAFPSLTGVVVIGVIPTGNPNTPTELRRTADALGLRLVAPQLRTDDDVAQALAIAEPTDGIVIVGNALVFQNVARIKTFASGRQLAVVYSRADDVRTGGLMSYGSNRKQIRLAVAPYVRRIAEGADPRLLPVQLPTKFDLAMNLQSAARSGLAPAASVVARADPVIR
jgi:putative ABC transport system substrate-binding protein